MTRRPATPADTEFARRVHHAAYRDVVEAQFGAWNETQQDALFEFDWASSRFEILESEGDPCGYTAIVDRGHDVLVRELVIHPDHQGRGIGTAILIETITAAHARQKTVVLAALHANRAAELYQRLGFAPTGRTDTHTEFALVPR